MPKIAGKSINIVSVVDDDENARISMGWTVESAEFEQLPFDGPLPELPEFVNEVLLKCHGAVCDHHLKAGPYASFNGVEAVAALYDKGFPAVLITRWTTAVIASMRPYLRKVPVVLNTKEADPDSIIKGLERCINEFGGKYVQTRKGWRTLIRVEEITRDQKPNMAYLSLTSWESDEVVGVPLDIFPAALRDGLKQGSRFHAVVNIGAERQEELYFDQFECS